MSRLTILFVFFALLLLGSCSILGISGNQPPYLLLSVKVISGAGSAYKVGLLSVNLRNKSEKAISSLELEFDIYDTEGSPQPQIGNNHIRSVLDKSIAPGANLEMEVVLDDPFSFVPNVTLTVTRFCITEITYEDGTQWQDSLRLNVLMSDSVETEKL